MSGHVELYEVQRGGAREPSATAAQQLAVHPAVAVGMITTAALSRVLGKGNARAARDWCKRHGIALRRDGKHNWVDLLEVKHVLAGLPPTRAAPATSLREEAVFDAAATLMRRR